MKHTMSNRMKTLATLFLDELADIYDAENRLVRALPKMAKAARHEELSAAFETHLEETEGHVKKLQDVFKTFGKPAKAKKCEAIAGLLEEGDQLASENKGSPTIDAALISAGQKVEHYEIASYGCLREWAGQLGNEEAGEILQEILDEEKTADETLIRLAREGCNQQAEGTGSEAEDELRRISASNNSRQRSGRRMATR
jgi:ferritin-like metal-binding protein YciE